MKKVLAFFTYIFLALFVSTFFIGCSKKNIKSNYSFNEEAVLDHFDLKLKDASYLENDVLELTFEITNNSKNSVTINADNYFKLYDINQVQVLNKYTANTNIIKKDETINYTLQYNINKKEIYEIYFYSGVVENNIKFTITSSDLK